MRDLIVQTLKIGAPLSVALVVFAQGLGIAPGVIASVSVAAVSGRKPEGVNELTGGTPQDLPEVCYVAGRSLSRRNRGALWLSQPEAM
jgi:hypothetical protein